MSTYVITGTNRGIGLGLCKQLSEDGHEVIAVCRKASDELKKLPVEVIDNIDVNNNIDDLKNKLAGKKIDVLINNAGMGGSGKFGEYTPDLISKVINTNAISPLLVSQALLGNLDKGSKLIMITSRMGSIEDNASGGTYSYRMSKAALNAATKSLSIDLKPQGIIVGLLHPGWVDTEMGSNKGIPVSESVTNILNRIDECTLENSGEFMHANGERLPW